MEVTPVETQIREQQQAQATPPQPPLTGIRRRASALFVVLTFILGAASGYLLRGSASATPTEEAASVPTQQPSPSPQLNLPDAYTIAASFGDLGPRLLDAGAIDYDRFVQLYEQIGRPLTAEQLAILSQGGDAPIVINRENAHFLLNFFWAVGLSNKNRILEEGPMMRSGKEQVGRFASTGGWTLGASPATALYASTPMIALTSEQQARLEEVASGVYRPCCNNPTHFPDCNHGMAMLGLLELMAGQNASVDEMFTAAKYVNGFWFPQQTLELATFFKARQGVGIAEADARLMVGRSYASGAGFQAVHQWLAEKGLLAQAPGSGGSCGVQ